MRETKYYNIHGIVRVACNIDYLPKHFEVDRIDEKDLDIIIQMGDFDFDKSKHKKLGLRYWGGNDNLYLEYKIYGISLQKFLIKNLFGKTTEFKCTKVTSRIFSVEQFIHLMTTIKLLQKGYTFVHAAGVAKNGRGYLITAWSEMGKSSTLFGLSKQHDFGMMGDDAIILSGDGTMYSYPMTAGVFFHSENVKNLKLSLTQRVKLMIKYLVAKLPPLYLYINPNLQVELSTIGRITDKAKLEKTYFLEWGEGKEKLDRTIAINKILSTTLHGHDQFYFAEDTFLAYCYLNNSDPHFIKENRKIIIQNAIGECILIRSRKKDFHKSISELEV